MEKTIRSQDRPYTRNEEIFNAISHGLGSLLGVVGTSVMVTVSALLYNGPAVAASIIYGLRLIPMFTMNTP